MSEINLKHFSTFNFADKKDKSENEDAIACKPGGDALRFSLSDGAGGVGVLSAEWAVFLVHAQPEKYHREDQHWKDWFLKTAEAFYEQINPQQNISDPLVLQKFFSEGSFATLLYLWIDTKQNQLISLAIGDTCLFHFSFGNDENFILKKIYPLMHHRSLDDFPQLLNWNTLHPDWPAPYQQKLEKQDIIICCTDALAKFFISALFSGDPAIFNGLLPQELLEDLESKKPTHAPLTPRGLMQLINELLDNPSEKEQIEILKRWVEQGLEEDDYTISYYIHG